MPSTTLLTALGALALATTIGAQAPTPATQPVRPPDPAPTGPRVPPLAPAEPDLGSDRGRPVGDGDGDSGSGAARPAAGTLTLQGCLHQLRGGAFRLLPVAGNDATVTEAVRLGGSASALRAAAGRVAEVRGRYEQATPATMPATFRVERVKSLATACPSS